jgi:hypothetical protein
MTIEMMEEKWTLLEPILRKTVEARIEMVQSVKKIKKDIVVALDLLEENIMKYQSTLGIGI